MEGGWNGCWELGFHMHHDDPMLMKRHIVPVAPALPGGLNTGFGWVFKKSVLLRYNLHITNTFKCTVQWVLTNVINIVIKI